MQNWMKILGSILISLGILVLVTGCLTGFGFWILSLIQDQQYPTAVGSLGAGLIVLGYLIRKVFNNKST